MTSIDDSLDVCVCGHCRDFHREYWEAYCGEPLNEPPCIGPLFWDEEMDGPKPQCPCVAFRLDVTAEALRRGRHF